MPYMLSRFLYVSAIIIAVVSIQACHQTKSDVKDEQIRATVTDQTVDPDSLANSISGDSSMSQLNTKPQSVILTGMPDHRLVSIYRVQKPKKEDVGSSFFKEYSSSYGYEGNDNDDNHYMPGIDVIYGYNLINLAHYDLKTEQTNLFFSHPVLIKTLYYPCFEPDSLNDQPISRDYYFVSVYDEDTNHDTLINRKDLRRFYHFNASASIKTQILPPNYSVTSSQYDPGNDVMYLYARQDTNNDGTITSDEPRHIFWLSLKSPQPAKLVY